MQLNLTESPYVAYVGQKHIKIVHAAPEQKTACLRPYSSFAPSPHCRMLKECLRRSAPYRYHVASTSFALA